MIIWAKDGFVNKSFKIFKVDYSRFGKMSWDRYEDCLVAEVKEEEACIHAF